ncbi:MAG: helix-turn-helix domain-containing protein [Bacteroidales bacterium]|nr:helix-turn-helix domain-containing protein [Bacteroidales bacterium]
MKNTSFYNLIAYKKRQSEITKKNWQMGVYDFFRKRERRQCVNPQCGKWFEVKPADTKKFCSRKCAAQVNNNSKRSDMNFQTKEKIVDLYQRGLSMQEIADKMGWSLHKVSYWLDKCNISRRSPSEASYLKWNPNGDPFNIKNKLNKNEILLKGLGLGLYWGEGDKSPNNTSVRLSNTDPQLIKKFKEFLVKICGVKKEKFSYSLILFNDINEKEAIRFWTQHIGIKRKQLGKIIKIPPQGKGTYKKKSQFGVFIIIVTNKKLKEKILEQIREI